MREMAWNFFAVFQKGSGADPHPPLGGKGAGGETSFTTPSKGDPISGNGPNFWEKGTHILQMGP